MVPRFVVAVAQNVNQIEVEAPNRRIAAERVRKMLKIRKRDRNERFYPYHFFVMEG